MLSDNTSYFPTQFGVSKKSHSFVDTIRSPSHTQTNFCLQNSVDVKVLSRNTSHRNAYVLRPSSSTSFTKSFNVK